MVVNAKKTAMVCMSGATEYKADAYIMDSDNNRIGCGNGIKALGLRFSSGLDMEEQVRHIVKTMRSRYWTLRNLKGNGFNTEELLQVYKTMLRPVAEYACVVFHSSLTDEQDERLERLQNHALKCIYGGEKSARKLREIANISTLRDRREELCMKFALKCARDPVFARWFPQRTTRRSGRTSASEQYLEEKARCERMRNSPLFFFRRLLNGKEGKSIGVRNREYRQRLVSDLNK